MQPLLYKAFGKVTLWDGITDFILNGSTGEHKILFRNLPPQERIRTPNEWCDTVPSPDGTANGRFEKKVERRVLHHCFLSPIMSEAEVLRVQNSLRHLRYHFMLHGVNFFLTGSSAIASILFHKQLPFSRFFEFTVLKERRTDVIKALATTLPSSIKILKLADLSIGLGCDGSYCAATATIKMTVKNPENGLYRTEGSDIWFAYSRTEGKKFRPLDGTLFNIMAATETIYLPAEPEPECFSTRDTHIRFGVFGKRIRCQDVAFDCKALYHAYPTVKEVTDESRNTKFEVGLEFVNSDYCRISSVLYFK